jgi:hypothetical protein
MVIGRGNLQPLRKQIKSNIATSIIRRRFDFGRHHSYGIALGLSPALFGPRPLLSNRDTRRMIEEETIDRQKVWGPRTSFRGPVDWEPIES